MLPLATSIVSSSSCSITLNLASCSAARFAASRIRCRVSPSVSLSSDCFANNFSNSSASAFVMLQSKAETLHSSRLAPGSNAFTSHQPQRAQLARKSFLLISRQLSWLACSKLPFLFAGHQKCHELPASKVPLLPSPRDECRLSEREKKVSFSQ